MMRNTFLMALLLVGAWAQSLWAGIIKLAVAQTVIENRLDQNRDKLLDMMARAKAEGCDLVIFPENALYWAEIAVHKPSQAEIDAAIEQIAQKARSEQIYVVFGGTRKLGARDAYHNTAVVCGPQGRRLMFYNKNMEVPRRFDVCHVPVNVTICSDRGYLEHSDLPCLVQDAQVIIDISGGHGGDDGRPALRRIRYRPWAQRTDAYVIVANPVHDDTDFMGHSPWGGGSAIIRPDGSIQAGRMYEKDELIVEEINTAQATRAQAQIRRNHPVFKAFWDMGKKVLEGGQIDSVQDITPLSSTAGPIKIAAAQIACSRNMGQNIEKIRSYIQSASEQGADVVVFPELAVTGAVTEDIAAANQSELDNALSEICRQAGSRNIYVIVGMPYFAGGHRRNCAFVIGDDGRIRTRYAQLAAAPNDLFEPGETPRTMWFELKGVQSIVTIGDDADMVEIADLAANRGMVLHFHIGCQTYASADEVVVGKQRHLLMLMYAKYGAVVNAAAAGQEAGGMSMIASREGGHNKPSPKGLEHYLPYQTSVVTSAGPEETMLVATRKTPAKNDMDLNRYWRNRNRKNRAQEGWYDWIKYGAILIGGDAGELAGRGR